MSTPFSTGQINDTNCHHFLPAQGNSHAMWWRKQHKMPHRHNFYWHNLSNMSRKIISCWTSWNTIAPDLCIFGEWLMYCPQVLSVTSERTSSRHLNYKENAPRIAMLCRRTVGTDDVCIHKNYAQNINTSMKCWTEVFCPWILLIHCFLSYKD